MALRRTIDAGMDSFTLASRWGISCELSTRLIRMSGRVPFGISVLSGFRTREQQEELGREGRPTAPAGRSTHTTCPATGVDLLPSVAVTDHVKAFLGSAAVFAGLRWGGGSPVADNGIPSDWNHVDLGPRLS